MTADWRVERNLLPNGKWCPCPTHWDWSEVMEIDGKPYCLGCLSDAEWKRAGGDPSVMRSMFYNNSPYADELLALGVEPMKMGA